jgi:DNA-binding MarR family transcriptional regulator
MPKSVVRRESEHLYAQAPRSDAGRRLSDAVLRLRRAERAQVERAQRVSGLSMVDLTALRYLVQADRDHRDLSPKDMIVMLDTASATVTNVLERLVARNLVTRVQHPTDRRAHHLVPTAAGIALVDQALAAHHAAVVAAIDQLEDQDAETAAGAIARIADAIDRLS